MRTYRLSGGLMLLFLWLAWPSSAATDSLLRHLSSIPDDTNKVWALRDLAYYYMEKDLDSAHYFGTQGYALARQLQFVPGQIWNLYQMGLSREFQDDFTTALEHYTEGYRLARLSHDSLSQAKLLVIFGSAYYYQSNMGTAIYYFTEALSLSERIGYAEGQGHALNNLGIIYRHRRNYLKAQKMYQSSLALKQTMADTIGMVSSHYNLGLLYAYLQDYPNSLVHFERASALAEHLPSHPSLPEMEIGMGVAFYHLHRLEEAYRYLLAGLDKLKNAKAHEKISAMTYLGMIEIHQGQARQGLQRLLEAEHLTQHSDRLELKKVVTRELASAYELLQEPDKAIAYWKLHQALNDSLNSEQKLWAFEEMQARFEALEKDKKIQMQELELKRERDWKTKFVIILTLTTLISLVVLGWWLRQKKATEQKLAPKDPDHQLALERINPLLPTPLTARELDIIQLIEKGETNQAIASQLFVSENTVKTHLKNIFIKTEAKNRTDLIHRLRQLQLTKENHPKG